MSMHIVGKRRSNDGDGCTSSLGRGGSVMDALGKAVQRASDD